MKYSSFAIVAALFAAGSLASSTISLAADKAPLVQTVAVSSTAKPVAELYAQAPTFNEGGATRLDGQMISTSAATVATAQGSSEPAPYNLMALVVAGLAVMGSLAFRRSPNK
jgi:hypothetical protein